MPSNTRGMTRPVVQVGENRLHDIAPASAGNAMPVVHITGNRRVPPDDTESGNLDSCRFTDTVVW